MTMVYSPDLVGKKESVVDEILLLNPYQTPMLNLLGFSNPVISTTHTWYEDEMFATKSKVTAAVSDVAATEIKVAETEPFRDGAIVRVNEEHMLVNKVDEATKTLTVVRGYGGSSAAAITKDSEIEFLFVRGEEGADARDPRYKPRKKVENMTQIFDDSVKVTGTAEAIAQYGVQSEYEYEKAKKQLELALQLEKAIINGLRFDDGHHRQMRGIRSFIQSNITDAKGQPISVDMINGVSQKIYNTGGFSSGGQYALVVPATQKLAISNLQNDKIRIVQSETRRGQKVDHIVNDFGMFPIVMNDNLKPDELLMIDTNRVMIRPLSGREFHHKLLGITGDKTQGMLVGEYTLEFRQEKAHARINGLK
ncbi:SU10 major capsid protein [Paenibacillus alvei]|uniref:DUF5309 family protein n=1 Tax=Paenibacillus alvei TaxID=44250 RepID=A0AAP7A090_PAEAL|nr:DUF5309 family protein [Paenibacillus alvei]NOJ71412.1 DUF5309 family protein [Paenibacillus alvei]